MFIIYPLEVQKLTYIPVLYAEEAFYVIGGWGNSQESGVRNIGRLDSNTLAWSLAGYLNYGRNGHNAIYMGSSKGFLLFSH